MNKTEEIVRIIARDKKSERAPYYHAPEFGPDGKPVYYFDNDETLSSEEKAAFRAALPFTEVSDEHGVIKINHLLTLRMSITRDKAIYYYLKNCPAGRTEVASDKNKSNPKKHRFFIENKEAEAEQNIKSMSVKFKALQVANEIVSARSDKNDIVRDSLRLLGIPIKGLTDKQVIDTLFKEADTSAARFLRMLDDSYRNYRIFIIKLIEKGTLKKSKSGSYTYGDANNTIAMNDNQMIAFLQDKSHSGLVGIWADSIGDSRILPKEEGKKEPVDMGSAALNITDAVNRLGEMDDEDQINTFVKSEQRPAVINAAKSKVKKLVKV